MCENKHEEEKITAHFTGVKELSKKQLEMLLKQQRQLTLIQYLVSLVIFIIGVVMYFCFKDIEICIGSISLEPATLNDITLNIGAILILLSFYMGAKITLNLNIDIK